MTKIINNNRYFSKFTTSAILISSNAHLFWVAIEVKVEYKT